MSEQRGRRLALPAPIGTVRNQHALAEKWGKHARLYRRLGEALALIEKDSLHESRIGHPRQSGAILHERLAIDGLGHHAQRVTNEGQEVPRQAERLARRRHGRRIERGAFVLGGERAGRGVASC